MVTAGRASQRGGSTLGCIVSLLIFAAAVYYGVNIGKVWLRYYQLRDEMEISARLAPSLADPVIRRRLEDKVTDLALPDSAKKFIIARTGGGRNREITIETVYSERVTLPLFDHEFVFKPRAVEPL
jgi:hypothetical protein